MSINQYFGGIKKLVKNYLSLRMSFGKKIAKTVLFILLALSQFFSHQASSGSGVYIPSDTGLPNTTFQAIFTNFLKWLLLIFGFLAIISFVITGIMYITSAGERERSENAKKQMYWSIIGVIVALSSYVILKAINTWFGGSSMF